MIFSTHTGILGMLVLTLAVTGCADSSQEELQKWMSDQKTLTKPKVDPIPEPKKFAPKAYAQDASTEPFSNQKLAQALKRDSAQSTSNAGLVAPELNRRKEPLEAYPLDVMSMVGSLVQVGQPIALVKIDLLLYQVKVGSYLGQNYGRVTKISETEVGLREIVQDAAGEWIERTASLQLQERSK
jgi:type IV pilus assembly protein PilP